MARSNFEPSSEPNPSSGTRGFLMIVVTAIVGALLLARLLFNPGAEQNESGANPLSALDLVDPPRRVGSDWQLESLETGQHVSLESLRGKVVFLNVWATWCPPCVREMPSIESLWEKFAQDPAVAFVLVASDDDKDEVRRFAAARKPGLPIYLPSEPAPKALRSNGIPATFVLDKDLAIRLKTIGSADWDTEPVANLLRSLVSGAAGAGREAGAGPEKAAEAAKEAARDRPVR